MSVELRKHMDSIYVFKDDICLSKVLCYASPEYYSDFSKAGIHTVTWNIPLGWVGPKKFNFDATDKVIEDYLSIDPNIMILPRIIFPGNNRDWWCEAHPEELVVLSNGELGSGHSSASLVWLEEASSALSNFIRHVENSHYSSNIIGYHICDGHFSEWFSWDSANFEKDVHALRWVCQPGKTPVECSTPWPDYSKPMLKAFREWVRRKYDGDLEELRRSWKKRDIDFSTITIPTKLERLSAEILTIRDPASQMNVIDYEMCFQDTHSDLILNLCKVAKSETSKLVGVFYGYIWLGFFRGFYMQNAGHLALSKILRSPYVDFLASPYDYENRVLGGACYSQSVPESAFLHGKMFFTEVDPKTFLTDPGLKWHHLEHFAPRTAEETVELLKRDYSYVQSMGMGMWWTDLFNQGWYHHENIIEALGKLRKIEERLSSFSQKSNSEIAVILDERSLLYERPCQNMAMALRNVQRQWELAFIGAPFDTYLQSDLSNPEFDAKRYKLFIFMNNVFVGKNERRSIDQLIKKDGKVVVWQWAPGLISDEGVSIDNMQQITGMKIDYEKKEGHTHIDIINYQHPITKDLPVGHCFGPELSRWHMMLFKESGFIEDDPTFVSCPLFYCPDTEATILGRLNPSDKPGFCIREFNSWTSIYIAIPYISKQVLRNIARFAGVHIYTDGEDLVYANRHFLSISPRLSGRRIIKLSKPMTVTDLWNGEKVCEEAKSFDIDVRANVTYMYLLE